jgi:hypothetical protein
MRGWTLSVALLAWSSLASAQYPPAQPYPQPYPQPPPQPVAPYPQPVAPYPQPAPLPVAPYPQPVAPYPQPVPQPYPPAQAPYPVAPYGQTPAPGYGPPQPLSAPYSMAPPAVPPPNRYRNAGEMAYLYGVSLAYGVGTGVWVDALAKESDPGIAVIAPLLLGAAMPIGVYAWDLNDEFDRGVPSSIATGLLLGSIEGIAIDGLQWQVTGNGGPHSWDFRTWTTVTFAAATIGGIGGYAFGDWLRPDPRSLGLIASGAGWGVAAGTLFGSGVVGGDWRNGAAVWGFAGYNAGILAAGVVSTTYVPSWQTLKYMWLGDLLGTLATTPVYLFYIGGNGEPRHGLIANAVGGLAGLTLAAALTANMTDPPGTASWAPPFQIAVSPTGTGNGAELMAFGQF